MIGPSSTRHTGRARIYRNDFRAWQWDVRDATGRPVMFGAEQTWAEALRQAARALELAPSWWSA